MTDVYIQLTYTQYKDMEGQLKDFSALETSHISVEGYYHKAFRLRVGDITFEIVGPSVKQPKQEET